MTDKLTENLIDALKGGSDAAFLTIRAHLENSFTDKSVMETSERAFNPFYFSSFDHCSYKTTTDVVQEWTTYWKSDKEVSKDHPYHCWIEFEWDGHAFTVLYTGVQGSHCREERKYIIGDSMKSIREFFSAVCKFCSEVRDEILVYDDGAWSKDEELFKAIKSSTLDNLILEGTLKEDIVGDIERFFASEQVFDKYKIAWKRGVLLLGPPGNGKTHMIKALANQLGLPCLYVRSIVSEYATEQNNINSIFERARNSAPCLLVLEDLDAIINSDNRSYFLNELDGFYENRGLFVLATTNHPENLDPAIIDRPSRFDRKYHFELPDAVLRNEYLTMWNAQISDELRISEEEMAQVVQATDGFSFAYLKELGLSSLMSWIEGEQKVSMIDCLIEQARWLKEQMSTTHDESEDHAKRSKDRARNTRFQQMRAMRKRMLPQNEP